MLQSKLKEGQKVTCIIYGVHVTDAKVHREGGRWYICQNERDGNRCSDTLGYEYSWALDQVQDEIEGNAAVTDFKVKIKKRKIKFKVLKYIP